MRHKTKTTQRIEKNAAKALRAIYGKTVYNQLRVKQLLTLLKN